VAGAGDRKWPTSRLNLHTPHLLHPPATTAVWAVNRQSAASVEVTETASQIVWFRLIIERGALARLDHPWS
jgi:hypothetical protein